MNIGKSFTFVFDDPDWIKKLVIGGFVAMIPVVNFAAMGYIAKLVRAVSDNPDAPLPEWDNFGDYFSDGFKVIVGLLVYALPAILLMLVFMVIMAAAGGFSDNFNSDTGSALLGGGMFLLQCVIFIYALAISIVIPAAFARFAEVGTIGSMLRFGEIFRFITANPADYIIVLLLSFAVLYLIAPLGVIACLIGVIFTQWWGYLVFGHLTGQLAGKNAMPLNEMM